MARTPWYSIRIGAAAAITLLVAVGCSLETPETPRFDTTLYVPLEEERYEGHEMAAGLEAVHGDAAQPAPLTIRVSRDLAPVYVRDHLVASIAGARFETSLDGIDFDPPEVPPASLRMTDLFPAADLELPIPESSFAPDPIDLGAFTSYTILDIATGTMRLRITNSLPVPIGGSGEDAVSLFLEDLSTPTPRVVTSWLLAGELNPGGTFTAQGDLSGQTVGNHLQLRVSGWSAGSDGQPVVSDPDQALTVELAFGELAIRRLTGELPALNAEVEASLDLGEQITVAEAVVASGQLRWQVQSFLPVDARLILEAPQITREATPLRIEEALPAQGTTELRVDLAAARMDLGGNESLSWRLAVSTDGTSEPACVEVGTAVIADLVASEISFESLTGVIDHVGGAIDPTAADLDFPDGTAGAQFVAAELTVVLQNRAAVAVEADLELWGEVDGRITRVPFHAGIPPAADADPESATVRLNESNSAILDLINLRPETVWVSGSVALGDGQTTVALRSDDFLDGNFTLEAPVRLVLETARQEGDPFTIELDEEIREQIVSNLLAVHVTADVENHFPTGVEIRLHFARTAGALFANDDLVLVADEILPATVDSATGRVTAAVVSEVRMEVTDHEDIQIFGQEMLFGAIEAILIGDGENPVEIWSTDYVAVRGMVSFRYRVD